MIEVIYIYIMFHPKQGDDAPGMQGLQEVKGDYVAFKFLKIVRSRESRNWKGVPQV